MNILVNAAACASRNLEGSRDIDRNHIRRKWELCSISVSTLRNLPGYHVYREECFQAGHGRCVFRVDTTRPIDLSVDDMFILENAGDGPVQLK